MHTRPNMASFFSSGWWKTMESTLHSSFCLCKSNMENLCMWVKITY